MIVVTGGAGFIGSNIAADLAAAGSRIVVCDLMRSGPKWRNLVTTPLYDLIRPDALFDWLGRHCDKVAAVVHMGAVSTTYEPDIDKYVVANVRLTLDLWEWCAANATRFVYASSAATYGDGAAGFRDDATPAALAALRPLNAYGWSKHLVDRRIADDLARGRSAPPQWAGLKFFNVYGPNEAHKGSMQSMAAKIAPSVKAGGSVTLFKSHDPHYRDGGQLRDFVYVKDCVAVVGWLLANPEVNGLFNVGSGAARSFADLVGAVAAVFGTRPNIVYVDTPPELRAQYQYFTQAELTKLRAAGFTRSFHTLEAGVRDFLARS
ncbi:MAG TPA: ADP-glyceromanno-heptose 6-epimerase [Stellaceae bacterium]|nr:ADP-glyceromanno-heptose 6-epimerase [Stellaceae bacterium]